MRLGWYGGEGCKPKVETIVCSYLIFTSLYCHHRSLRKGCMSASPSISNANIASFSNCFTGAVWYRTRHRMKPARPHHGFSVQAKSISIQGTGSPMIAKTSRALYTRNSVASATRQRLTSRRLLRFMVKCGTSPAAAVKEDRSA